jgi:hypothetical protein
MTRLFGRRAVVTYALGIALTHLPGQQAQPRPSNDYKSPKCAFLRSEVRRIAEQGQDFEDSSPFSRVGSTDALTTANLNVADWAQYEATAEEFTARKTLFGLEAFSCERGVQLSDKSRLVAIEKARATQVERAAGRWQASAGDQGKDYADPISAKINAVYESDTQSFYNSPAQSFNDPDVGKDYAGLSNLIQDSSLDQSTKNFFAANLSRLRYEEAGKLSDTLEGVDKTQGLDYAYLLRNTVANRVSAEDAQDQQAAQKQAEDAQERTKERIGNLMNEASHYAIAAFIVLVLFGLLWVATDRTRAKYRAFRLGLKRSPFWFGNAEWIFWEPGETIVLLRHKKLVPMKDRDGGYRSISSWNGEEYKGRISYKTQFSTWKSDPIITSDGLSINLNVGIWWRIVDASLYVSRIASDYHENDQHKDGNLTEAAEEWIEKLAAGTLREEVNQLPAEKLISPYVQAYLQVRSNSDGAATSEEKPIPNFAEQLGKTREKLNQKTLAYGIEVERFEVQELILPPMYQQKLEAVRIAFLEPTQATALTNAQAIALQGLAGVIGKDRVGLIEVLKHVDISHINMNPFTGVVPIVQPMLNALQQQSERALPTGSPDDK